MELKPGYKQTEMGVIPEDWESTTVSGIASSAQNAIVGGPFGSELVTRDYVDHGVPVIRGQNLTSGSVSGNFVFVTPAKAISLGANLARAGDIVFTQRGTLGQVSLVPEVPFERYLVSQSQMKLSVNREVADPLFFYYVFSSVEQQKYIRLNTIQTGVPHINLGILRKIPVQLPGTLEQRAIAGALSDVDALIGALDQLIAKKRDLKQAAMQQLLTGQKRLPGFGKTEECYRHTLIGAIPDDWEVRALQDGAKLVSGHHVLAHHCNTDGRGVPYITGPADFPNGAIQHTKFTERPATICRSGDILVTVKGSGAGSMVLSDGEYCISRQLMAIRVTHWDTRYVYSSLLLDSTRIGSAATGLIPGLSRGDLLHKQVVVAPLPEQIAITAVLSDMDAEIAALEARRDKTRALKQGMMQELLTGRIRLV
jgi:type I restriction enzyme S subunit